MPKKQSKTNKEMVYCCFKMTLFDSYHFHACSTRTRRAGQGSLPPWPISIVRRWWLANVLLARAMLLNQPFRFWQMSLMCVCLSFCLPHRTQRAAASRGDHQIGRMIIISSCRFISVTGCGGRRRSFQQRNTQGDGTVKE